MPLIYRLKFSDMHVFMRQSVKAGKQDREICGILLAQNSRLILVPVKNLFGDVGGFEMWYPWIEIALNANKYGEATIVGSYHSHPSSAPIPGLSDIDGARSNSLMLIIGVWRQKVGLWKIQGNRARRVVLCIYRGD